MKRLLLSLLAIGLCTEAHALLSIYVWNCTGRPFGQWGTGGEANCAGIHRPGGDTIGGLQTADLAFVTGQDAQGTYTLYHSCLNAYGYPWIVVTSGYYAGDPPGQSSTVWNWFVFDDGCANCSSPTISQLDDPSDGVPRWNNPDDDCQNQPQSGMASWHVSEPYISLWLKDEPLGYDPAIGPRISFALAYDQRESLAGMSPNIFSAGKKWNCSWLSFVSQDENGSNVVSFAGGGRRTSYGTNDFLTGASLAGDVTNGFTLTYPDGSKDVFGFIVTNSSGVFSRAFLTERWSPQAQKTLLQYAAYNPSTQVIRLQFVVDGDGRTNFVYYTTSNSYSTNLISQVVDAYGRSCSLFYDSNGLLTNITDVAGISSAFTYDGNNWPNTLATPYGTTSFTITDTSGTNVVPNGRSVLVTEPDGSHQLYLYQDSAPGVTNSYPASEVPNTGSVSNNFENSQLDLRDTFHWGRRQYAALPTTNISAFNAQDFRKARMQHWLKAWTNSLSEIVSLRREPSPDSAGSIAGQKTWYDYIGKPSRAMAGSQQLPLFVGQVLPDGSTRLVRTDRNSYGYPTTDITTYGSGSPAPQRTNTFTYAANNIDLILITNAAGVRVLSNAYNSYHQVLTNYNALNEVTTYAYNANRQLTSATRPSGLVTTNTYFSSADSLNRLASTVDYAVIGGNPVYYRTNSFTWTNGLIATHTDPRGLTLTTTWDALQRLRRVDYPDDTFVTNTYANLDLVRVVDRMGFTNSFGFNALRQLVAVTNANGVVTRYTYCDCGSLESITNAFGTSVQAVTLFSYDNQGNLLQTVAPDNYAVAYNYNALGQITNITDYLTSITNWYNNQGLLVASSNAFGLASSAVYDVLDRVTNSVDANSVGLTNTYDNLNRFLTRGYPDGGVERFGYTANTFGPTSYTNQLGSNAVNYVYDPFGRKLQEIVPGVFTNSFLYTPAGELNVLTDGKNQQTTWHFDVYGQVTNKVDANGTEILRYHYDPNGRLTNRWSIAKANTRYAFDPAGNLTNIVYPVSPSIVFRYDPLDRLTNMLDGVGATAYSYTSAGLLQAEDGPWTDDIVTYSYNSYRLRSGLSLQVPNGSPWVQGYGYDSIKRISTLTSPAGAFGYSYPSSGRQGLLSALQFPNGAFITNSYDSVARLLSTVLKNNGGTVLNSHSYINDLAGRRTRQTRTEGAYVDYGYDNASQLISALGKESGGSTNRLNEQFGYGYDAAGNLNFRTNDDLHQAFGVNSLNELTSATRNTSITVAGTTTSTATDVTVNSLSADHYFDSTFARAGFSLVDGTNTFTAIAHDSYGRSDTNAIAVNLPASVSYSYDLNGNLTGDGRRIFGYDDENQLTSVIVTNGPTDSTLSVFAYDGKMRRRLRFESTWNGSAWVTNTTVRYVYDGNLVIQERDGNNLPVVSYTRGRDMSGSLQGAGGIGGLLARIDNRLLTIGDPAAHAYYQADGSGNVTALINANQAPVAKYLYDAFGNILSQSGPLADGNLYRFSSKEFHGASGTHYFLYRFYDPTLQGWLNQDPIGEVGGLNLYSYIHNSPLNFVDPFGLSEADDVQQGFRYTAYSMPTRTAPAGVWGYTDAFGNWSPTFCLSCHGNTPTADFYRQQSVLANMLDYKVLAYEQALALGLTFGFGSLAEQMENAAYLRNLPQMNRACGLAAEARVEQQLIAEGNTILGAHVGARTTDGLRFIDRLVQTPSLEIMAVEVKSGGAIRDAQQLLRDNLMATEGATLVGRNAPPVLRGREFVIPTVERR